ncbi:MAG: aa3-type cytochrome c oxidase subunit IV, partial [Caulobacteraceae bacterium]
MAETASEYHHGQQNVSEQASTWRRFMLLTRIFALHIAVIILVCTLWFCAGANFWGGFIPGVILVVIGVWY